MQILAPLSAFEFWLVMNVNVALILVPNSLLNNCAEKVDESPQNHSGSGHKFELLAEDKGVS